MNTAVPPPIAPVAGDAPRPLWSVMIPTYNCAGYLRQTLASVLAQDPGTEAMQIEVIDDCSTQDDPAAVVGEIGKGRIAFFRQPANQGATATFNTCVARSRGELVHILHGDDLVHPGFYARVQQAATEHPACAAYFVRSFVVEADSAIDSLTPRLSWLEAPSRDPGSLPYQNDIRAPGAVVRRSFYERTGGFHTGLIHTADWEMWLRAITDGGGLFINAPLCAYRRFPGNDTGRLARTADNLRDYIRLSHILAARSPRFDAARFRGMIMAGALEQVIKFEALGDEAAVHANMSLWSDLASARQRLGFALRHPRAWFRRR